MLCYVHFNLNFILYDKSTPVVSIIFSRRESMPRENVWYQTEVTLSFDRPIPCSRNVKEVCLFSETVSSVPLVTALTWIP